MNGPPLLLLVVLLVAVLLSIEGLYVLFSDYFGGARRQTNRRLAMISRHQSVEVALRKLQRDNSGPLAQLGVRAFPSLERLLVESGYPGSVIGVVSAMFGLVFALFFVGAVYTPVPAVLCALAATLLGVGVPVGLLYHKRAERIRKFAAQLPEAIDLMVRGLQVGHPVAAAMGLVAKHMADPAGSEFGIAVDEVAYGRSLSEALIAMAQRVPQDDLKYLVAVVQIQHQSGGNLAEVLANLGSVIRARFHMFAKIRAASAEGRMSGIAIGLIPLFVSGIIVVIRPDYFSAVAHLPLFWPIMGSTPVLLIAGWVMIWKLVNFKV